MKHRLSGFHAAVLAAMLALTPATAGAESSGPKALICKLRPDPASQGWVPEKVRVFVNPAGTHAVVQDFYTDEVLGGPIEARIEERSGKQLKLAWEMRTTDRNKVRARQVFRLVIKTKGLRATYSTMRPRVFPRTWYEASGKCAPERK
ncbi:MAG: hypothetical protein R3D63_13695 [Paracoccaceae bacterium]